MPAKLSDVARRARVSNATASRVLNDQRFVSAGARTLVEEAARALDYVPNRAAQDLSRARTSTIAFLVHRSHYPARGELASDERILLAVSLALAERGHDLLYSVVGEADAMRLVSLPAARPSRSDGLLLLGPAFPPPAVAALAAARPTVLIDNLDPGGGADAVLADNQAAVRQLTFHLLEVHGYRDIACLAGPEGWASTRERVAGYREAMVAAGAPPQVLHGAATTIEQGAALLGRLEPLPEAVVAINDAMAVGALRHLRRRSPRRPSAVVGFDDTAWAATVDPPLTTVAVDMEAMGRLAAGRLLERLAARPDEASLTPRILRAPAVLRVRRSCGCPEGGG